MSQVGPCSYFKSPSGDLCPHREMALIVALYECGAPDPSYGRFQVLTTNVPFSGTGGRELRKPPNNLNKFLRSSRGSTQLANIINRHYALSPKARGRTKETFKELVLLVNLHKRVHPTIANPRSDLRMFVMACDGYQKVT